MTDPKVKIKEDFPWVGYVKNLYIAFYDITIFYTRTKMVWPNYLKTLYGMQGKCIEVVDVMTEVLVNCHRLL